jgi:DNA-binding IscR family transcriptional regulator
MRQQLASMRKPPDNSINRRIRELSLAMLHLGAISPDKRRSVEEVVTKAFGDQADPRSLNNLMREMKTREFVETKLGPRGGVWLSAKGLERANR